MRCATPGARGVPARAGLLLAVSLLAAACATSDRAVAPAPRFAAAAEDLEAHIAELMEDLRLPALSIAVLDRGEMLWARGFGEAREGVPAAADTVYRVGSISKLFTDVAVMRLVEQGRLALDEPVATYLPDFQPRPAPGVPRVPITLRHLMTHHAGLLREPPVGHYFDPGEPGLAATVDSLGDTALVAEPGTRFKYSNAGLAVVGRVVEVVAGEPFAAFVQREVIDRLRLGSTSFVPRGDLRGRRAAGWMWTYDGREFAAPEFELGMIPAANLYSTVVDLARFAGSWATRLAQADRAVLAEPTQRAMFAPQWGRDDVGLGFFLGRLEGHLRVGHNGAMYGFATELAALPEEGLAVAVVTNVDFANDAAASVADRALRWLLAARAAGPVPAPAVRPRPVGAARAAALAGVYRATDGTTARLLVRGEDLWVVPPRGFRLRLRHRGGVLVAHGRTVLGMPAAVVGEAGAEVLRLGARSFTRVEELPPPPIASRHAALVGEYGWDHDTLFVLERDGALRILIEWFAEYPLTERGFDRFELRGRGLYQDEPVVFARDARGAVTHVTVGGVRFARRSATDVGDTFRIVPVRTEADLRARALAAQPPPERGAFRRTDLVQPLELDPTLRLDLRYATTNNFMGLVFYPRAVAYLQRPAAEALVRVHRALAARGYGILVYDAYRPWFVTKMFWDATPESMKDFVADPSQGSRHNRGCAVDVTLFDLATGQPVPMVSGYDEFTARAYPDYPGGTARQRWCRDLLRRAMAAEGFSVYGFEWWHFDHRDWRSYPILNTPLR